MKTKIFTLFTALTLGAGTLFASNTAVDGIYYDFNATALTATVTYKGNSYSAYTNEYTGDVVIPTIVTYGGKTYSVTSIGSSTFSGCSGLISVTIPNSVTSIGSSAFNGCSSLTSVTIPNSVTSIGSYAFYGCSGLTSVTIPNSVTSIGNNAFSGCSGLTSMTVESENPTYDSRNNCNAIIETATNTLIAGCQSTIIPNSVTSIGNNAFSGCSGLTSITIPNSVTSIGGGAFSGCSSLTSVTIPNSVTSIGSSAFNGCSGLTSVVWNAKNYADVSSESYAPFYNIRSQVTSFTFGDEVKYIPAYLCYGMENLTSVTIPNSVTSIGVYAFKNCSNLDSVFILAPHISFETYTGYDYGYYIHYQQFYNCPKLKYIYNNSTLPTKASDIFGSTFQTYIVGDSVTSIGSSEFPGSLTEVTIGNSVTSIGNNAFSGCSSLTSVVWNAKNCADFSSSPFSSFITSFTFGDAVEHIPARLCFGLSKLNAVTIPNSVISIGEGAFSRCSSLTSVTIPNSVTRIGSSAFSGCSGLTSVVWNAKKCEDFEYSNYVPFYDIASPITSFTFGNEVEHIPAKLCYGLSSLNAVTIPNSVTSIGSYAFYNCSGLTAVTIPNSVTSIGEGAFALCSGLTLVTIPNSVTIIGHGAFYYCSGLTSVTIPNSVTSIGEEAFQGCSGLTSVTIPNSVTSIGDKAFAYCSGLTSITIPNSVTNISYYAFAECSGLTSVTIGNSVTSIEDEAFYGCSKLKTVVIGNAVTNIGRYAFYGCNRLIYVTCYAEEPPFVGADPFSTYNAYLKVPCSGLDAYKMYDVWRDFNNISCIDSEEVQVTEFNVTPSVNDAQFTWPADPGAATYELVISKDGVVFCTLTFNASGQLMGIAFAPSANAPAAAPTTSGFQFTVTGLDEALHYTYTFDAKDAGGNVIKHYAGEFNTEGSTVGLEQIELANIYTQDGRIVCEGEFCIYDLLGRDVTRLNGLLCGVYVVKTGNAAVKVVVK